MPFARHDTIIDASVFLGRRVGISIFVWNVSHHHITYRTTWLYINGCIVWHAHDTVFGSKRSAICTQAVYFLQSTRPSVTWLKFNSRWRLAACEWVMSAFDLCRVVFVNPRRTSQKIWGGFLYWVYITGKWLCIYINGKYGSYKYRKSYFGSELPAICNHCGVN